MTVSLRPMIGSAPADSDLAKAIGSGSFRPDIEGLRAVAVLLILLYHAGIPAIPGGYIGVDVFFVISGFLITGLLLRELEDSGTINRGRFYARRVRRLLPAAAIVLVSVAALTIIALPTLRWAGIAADIRWSALYSVNWRFAAQASDYLAAQEAASPLQHFWSLAVEEHFYLVWPLVLLSVGSLAARRRYPLRATLVAGLAVLSIPSLIWSIYLTGAEPGRAFFVSTTRIWELAAGGCLAILSPAIARLSRRSANALAATGTAGILGAALLFDARTVFPGIAAALPVLATAALIAAGTAAPGLISRGLGWRPLQHIGALSYSLYLWHWPFVVVAVARWGPLTPWQGTAAVVVSVLPALASYHLVERRARYSEAFITPPRRGLVYGAGLTAVGLLAASALTIAIPDRPVAAAEEAPPPTAAPEPTPPPTSAVTTSTATPTTTTSTTAAPEPTTTTVVGPIQPDTELQLTADVLDPDPLDARADLPAVYGDGCHQVQAETAVTSCYYGAEESDIEVVVVGDSHAAMWVPTLRVIADEQGWALRTMTKSNCQLAGVVFANGPQQSPYTECVDWTEAAIEELIATQPSLVLVAGRFWPTVITDDGLLEGSAATTALTAGLIETWQRLDDADLEVVAVRDVPYPEVDVAECVSEHRDDLGQCALDRAAVTSGNTPHKDAAAAIGIDLVDLTDQICLTEVCPAVTDDVLVWRDTHHLTATYARLLAATFAHQLIEAAPGVFAAE